MTQIKNFCNFQSKNKDFVSVSKFIFLFLASNFEAYNPYL